MAEVLAEHRGAELERLMAEHSRHAQRLEELMSNPYQSAEEQMEELRLKKLKLHTKDLIAALERSCSAVA